MDTLTNKKMEISALFEVKRCLTDLIKQCDTQITNKAKELQALELLQRNEKNIDNISDVSNKQDKPENTQTEPEKKTISPPTSWSKEAKETWGS